MSRPKRVAELRSLLEGAMEVNLKLIHERIEQLVGRPVWTHEFALPESLYAELETGDVPDMELIIGKIHQIKPDMPVIVIQEAP